MVGQKIDEKLEELFHENHPTKECLQKFYSEKTIKQQLAIWKLSKIYTYLFYAFFENISSAELQSSFICFINSSILSNLVSSLINSKISTFMVSP